MNAKKYGYYDIGSTEALQNANEIRPIFEGAGYSTLSVCAICGAFQQESQMNPWLWEGGNVQPSGNISRYVGYGFPQFTPATEYIGYANTLGDANINANYAPNFSNSVGNATDGIAQCYFILRHIETNDGWLNQNAQRYESILADYIPSADAHTAVNMSLANFKRGSDGTTDYTVDVLIAAFVACYLRPAESSVRDHFVDNYLYYSRWYSDYFNQTPSSFSPRLTANGIVGNKWWYSNGNVFYASGYGMSVNNGNCTCYAYGRWGEIRNAFANLPSGDAGTWYDNVQGFEKGSTPRLGAIACYKSRSGNPQNPGHVSVVEVINGTQITTSNSGWGGPFFWTADVTEQGGYLESWMNSVIHGVQKDYYCQGFIYLDTYVPPTPPTPSTGEHHIKPYYYINIIRRK